MTNYNIATFLEFLWAEDFLNVSLNEGELWCNFKFSQISLTISGDLPDTTYCCLNFNQNKLIIPVKKIENFINSCYQEINKNQVIFNGKLSLGIEKLMPEVFEILNNNTTEFDISFNIDKPGSIIQGVSHASGIKYQITVSNKFPRNNINCTDLQIFAQLGNNYKDFYYYFPNKDACQYKFLSGNLQYMSPDEKINQFIDKLCMNDRFDGLAKWKQFYELQNSLEHKNMGDTKKTKI